MTDETTTLAQLKKAIDQVVEEREWHQFHTPKNLSMNLAVEASELMEKFVWLNAAESFAELASNKQEIEHELADVLANVLCFANAAHIDLTTVFERKLRDIKEKYPIEKAKGKHTKYTKLS